MRACVLSLACVLCFPALLSSQNRPLRTPDTEIVEPGTTRVQAGFDFLQDISFPLSGLTGDLTSVAVISVRTGFGRVVELQFEGAIHNFLSVKNQVEAFVTPELTGPGSTTDFGDFSAYTKVRLLGEGKRRPAIAFRVGFQMPNSNQRRGIGTNTTNLFTEIILQKHIRQLDLFGSVGLGILQSPAAQFSQNDVLLYGLGFRYPLHDSRDWGLKLVGEVAGRHSSRDTRGDLVGTESRGQARLGVEVRAGGFYWDLAGIRGLYRDDPSSGFTFGLRRDIRLFPHSPND